jgi:outer membrane protein OmpA-like peptidoglycan-associated protein
MNKQNQWLFEVLPASALNFSSKQEFFNNSEWETEWKIQEYNPYTSFLEETEWEIRETRQLPRRHMNKQPFQRQIPYGQAQSILENSPQVVKPKPIAIIDRFEFGSYLLKKHQFERLHDLMKLLQPMEREGKLSLLCFAGHTDNIGGESKSTVLLSMRRALEIESFIRRAFEKSTLKTRVFAQGSLDPIAANTTENGRSLNRRVEVFSETQL